MLYIVATPIGNLKDITLRALEVLKTVDAIACEDTRHSKALLTHYDINKKLIPYHDFSSQKDRKMIIARLQAGESIALISDAGTPLISDPGYKLVKEVQQLGIALTSIPGASAVATALTLSGAPTDQFSFIGFLPSTSGKRVNMLKEVKHAPGTLVCFERASRVKEALTDIHSVFGACYIAILREMTKKFEEIISGNIDEILTELAGRAELKGEIVMVIAPKAIDTKLGDIHEGAYKEAIKEMGAKKASAVFAMQTGLSKKELYQHALSLKEKD